MRLRWAILAVIAALAGAGLGACGSSRPVTTITRTLTVPSKGSTTTVIQVITTSTDGTAVTGTTTTTALPGTGRPIVLLGDMNTPEEFILGAIYQEALATQGYAVELSRNIGTTQVSLASLAQGSLDIFPEYLNIWDSQVVGDKHPPTSLDSAFAIGEEWAEAHKLELLPPTPFSDTGGIAVLSTTAKADGLRSLGDLGKVAAHLVLGSPLEYTNDPAGLPAIERAYDFKPFGVQSVNIGSQYADLKIGWVQAAYVSTTDGQLQQPMFRLLADPHKVFGFGNVVPVVSQATLEAEGPDFAATIEQVDALLTQGAMRGLNAEVSLNHHDPDLVAREFLQGYGILPPAQWPSATTTTVTSTTPTQSTTTG